MNDRISSEQEFLAKITKITEANLHNEQFGVNELARAMGMSRITLHRKITQAAGISVSQFISQLRLKKAVELLKQNSATVSEVAYQCGFNSPTYFSKCFHDYFGFPPGEAKNHDSHGTTEKPETETPKAKPAGKRKWTRVAFVVAIALIATIITSEVFFFRPFKKNKNYTEKSIAVLPFINDSPDTTNVYFINGVTEEIINKLSSISDLKVVSRSSAEQYRNKNNKSIKQIARELGVNYIVEGSGQKSDSRIKVHVQLIEANTDKHLLSEIYERNLEEIFSLQSEIALSVANKIDAVITPEEKKQIERKPTQNIAALNQFLKGTEIGQIASLDKNKSLSQQAEAFFKKAVQLDSTYVEPYIGLGWNYSTWHGDLDSGLYFANRALHFDNKNAEALSLKGWILMTKGLYEESEQVLLQAIKYNPNNASGYQILGTLAEPANNFEKSIGYFLKALKLQSNKHEARITLNSLGFYLSRYGFFEEALKFAEMQIKINNDSLTYYQVLAEKNMYADNYEAAYINAKKSVNWNVEDYMWTPFRVSLYLEDYKKAVEYVEETADNLKKRGLEMYPHPYYGFAYLNNGQKEKADYHFEGAIKSVHKRMEKDKTFSSCRAYFDLVFIYSAMGDKEKAIENLRKSSNCMVIYIHPDFLRELKTFPIFDTIRNEPEFQKLIRDSEISLKPKMKNIEKILQDYWSEN